MSRYDECLSVRKNNKKLDCQANQSKLTSFIHICVRLAVLKNSMINFASFSFVFKVSKDFWIPNNDKSSPNWIEPVLIDKIKWE
jgi:hypothetical protein